MTSGPERHRQLVGLHLKVQVAVLVLIAMLVAGAVALAVAQWFRTAT